jgi:hypothetical protein
VPRSQRGIVFLSEAEDRFRFRFRSSVPPPRRAPAAAAGRSREAMSPMRSRAQLSVGRRKHSSAGCTVSAWKGAAQRRSRALFETRPHPAGRGNSGTCLCGAAVVR